MLIGLRASGKTTVGALLARDLGLPFVDLDALTLEALNAARAGAAPSATIADAWRRWGEPAFRHAESVALERALREPRAVVALGGGTPTAPGAADALRAARRSGGALICYLRAEPSVLRARLSRAVVAGADAQRPSLTGAGAIEEVDAVFAARDPLYRALADAIVDASGAPEACARDIAALVRSHGSR